MLIFSYVASMYWILRYLLSGALARYQQRCTTIRLDLYDNIVGENMTESKINRRLIAGLAIQSALLAMLAVFMAACGSAPAAPVEVTRLVEQPGPEVVREVEVTRIVQQAPAEAETGEAKPGVVHLKPQSARQVDVTLKEWEIAPSQNTIPAGDIYFLTENVGPDDPHELVIIKSDLPPDALPTVDGLVQEDHVEFIGEVERFATKSTASGLFNLDPGNYILICNLVEIEDGKLESHYELGMRTPFTVTEASAATGDAKDVADDPGELIIYSGRSESLVGPIIRQFADTTGIDVQVKYGKTGALAATLLEEGDKSPADVFYAQDPGGLAAVSHMTVALPSDLIEMTPQWARSARGNWVGITGRARVVVYGTDRLTEADLPDGLWGFTDPKWKGRVGWAPTNGSFQAMVTALRVGWGEERTEEWLRAMIDNDVQIYPKNTPQVAAAATGEIDVGLVNHYYLYRFLAEEGEEFAARNAHLRDGGPGAIVLVSGAGILKTADNHENAEKFIRFLLSPVGQQYFAGSTFEYPLVAEARPSILLTPLADIGQPDITLADLSDLAGTQALLQKVGALP